MYFNSFIEEVNHKLNIDEKMKLKYERTTNIIETAFEIIKAKIAEGENVYIRNFGTFKPKDKAERKGVNPKTGEEIVIPAHKRIGFSASKSFKELINEKD